jgi:hypothetical protein
VLLVTLPYKIMKFLFNFLCSNWDKLNIVSMVNVIAICQNFSFLLLRWMVGLNFSATFKCDYETCASHQKAQSGDVSNFFFVFTCFVVVPFLFLLFYFIYFCIYLHVYTLFGPSSLFWSYNPHMRENMWFLQWQIFILLCGWIIFHCV